MLIVLELLRPVLGGEVREDGAYADRSGAAGGLSVVVYGVAGEVEAGGLALHGHELAARILLHVRHGHGGTARVGLPLVAEAEEVELALDIVPPVGGDALEHVVRHLHERLAAAAQAVEGAGLYETFDRAAVELLAGHAAAELLKAREGPVLPALLHQQLYKALAYVLDGHEAETDVPAHDGEARVGLVHVRRQDLYAHLAAL